MNEERPIVFTITQNDAVHYRIYTRDSRTDLQANVGSDGLFHMLVSISEELNKQGYAVLFEVDNTVADLKAKLAEFPDDYPLRIFKSDDGHMYIRDIVGYDDTCEIGLI